MFSPAARSLTRPHWFSLCFGAFGFENINFPYVLLPLGSKTLIFLVFGCHWARKHLFSLCFVAFGFENIDVPCVLLPLGSNTLIFLVFWSLWVRKRWCSLCFVAIGLHRAQRASKGFIKLLVEVSLWGPITRIVTLPSRGGGKGEVTGVTKNE